MPLTVHPSTILTFEQLVKCSLAQVVRVILFLDLLLDVYIIRQSFVFDVHVLCIYVLKQGIVGILTVTLVLSAKKELLVIAIAKHSCL